MYYPPSIEKLINLFAKFPTVGPRTAGRFVFYLMKLPKEQIQELLQSVSGLKENIRLCHFCFNPFEINSAPAMGGVKGQKEQLLCPICQNPSRDKTLLCVVEKETDLITLEKTKKYKGFYFILDGTVSHLKKEQIEKLRTKELLERIKNPENFNLPRVQFKEIILATNPTTEGQATALYLERLLEPLNIKISRLGRGLPVGAELEYADKETLSSALEGRK